MNKKPIRLEENYIRNIVKESVKKVLNELELPTDEEGLRKSFDKQDYLFNSKVVKILKHIYKAGMDLRSEYIMDLCIEAQTELLREKGFRV